MSREHIDHGAIAAFAQNKVNLPKDKADEYPAQARRLRERLESHLAEHPAFTLQKMLLNYLAEKVRKAFPNFGPEQVKPNTYSVTVSFRGSGLDVEVVPILYSG